MIIGQQLLIAFAISFVSSSVLSVQTEVPAGAPVTLVKMPLLYKDWPHRRSADTVLKLESVRTVLSLFSEAGGQIVVVRYPGGDTGNAWALEFLEWLVAFGVPSQFITLEPGSGGADRLLILVEARTTI